MQRSRFLILSGMAAGLLALASPQAMAQSQPQAPAQAQPQPPPKTAADFSQEQIEKFADAAVGVRQLKTELDAQARKVETRDDLSKLQQRATVEASRVVEGSGLTIQEYSAIVDAANQDPRLYATIVDLMQQRSAQ